ncbi:MAG: energy-coupling factor transporter transmembrane component T [Microbacteriaceae bacterium]
MTIATPTRPARLIGGVNPLAKLGAALMIGICLILSIDWVSASVALALELVLFTVAGVSWRQFWQRTWPVWLAAPLAAVTIALYGQTSGEVYFEFLLARVSDGSLELALATALRILAVALPAVVLFITVDPTDLADSLAQLLRLPARFVLGALAALRLVGLFFDDWRSLELARRARGVGDRGRIRRLLGQAFALLVLSVRRGSKLATAMEARGFGSTVTRTWARQAHFGWRDALVVLAGLAIGLLAVWASVATGHWRFIAG